jgi:hypothetical protein
MTARKSVLKGMATAFFVLLGLPVFHARAGDYEVAYAIDAHGEKAMGQSAECTYKDSCRLTLDTLTSIAIVFYAKQEFNLYIYGRDGCCFFSDGESFVRIDAERPFHRLSIFEGRQRRGNEVVVNKKIGELFLAFRNLTPAPHTGPQPFSPRLIERDGGLVALGLSCAGFWTPAMRRHLALRRPAS